MEMNRPSMNPTTSHEMRWVLYIKNFKVVRNSTHLLKEQHNPRARAQWRTPSEKSNATTTTTTTPTGDPDGK